MNCNESQGKPVFKWLRLHGWPVFKQLQLEEALLRSDTQNWCIYNDCAPEAIVLGISNQIDRHLAVSDQQNDVPVIRRFSGGGSVVIDENTLFATFICNKSDIAIDPFPKQILRWTQNLYRQVFQGIAFDIEDSDYVVRMDHNSERTYKIGGNAQYVTRERWLHHTSFLWDFDLEKMSLLAMPPKMPAYRKMREHAHFLYRLKDAFSDKQYVEQTLKRVLEGVMKVEIASETEAMVFLKRPHRKTVTKDKI